MDIVFYVAILFGALALVSHKFVLSAILFALGWLGPVAYRFWLTGDESLLWEVAFRCALILICMWGAKQLLALQVDSSSRAKH